MDVSRLQLLAGFLLNKHGLPHPATSTVARVTIFALATGEHPVNMNIIGVYAAEAFAQAILQAVRLAKPVAGIPAISQ